MWKGAGCIHALSSPAPTNLNAGSTNLHGTLAVSALSSGQDSQPASVSERSYTQVVQGAAPPTISATTAGNPVLLRNIIENTIKTLNKKKCNIVISGMVESNGDQHDAASFVDLCRHFIDVDPHVTRCVRIGGGRTSTNQTAQSQTLPTLKPRPRLLLVTLFSEQQASEIMSYAKYLRDAQDEYVRQNIFFNYDISKEEAKLQYERRVERRRKANLLMTASGAGHSSELITTQNSNTINTTRGAPTALVATAATTGNVAESVLEAVTVTATAEVGSATTTNANSSVRVADVESNMVDT